MLYLLEFHKGQRKKNKKEVGKTGGGPAPDKLTPLEEKVVINLICEH